MFAEKEMQIKQDYLLQQIIECGYSPEGFQSYLETIKPNQSQDINSWTLVELKQAVSNFKNEQKVEIDLNDNQSQLQQSNEIKEQSPQKKKDFQKEIQCQKLPLTLIGSMEDLQIKIDSYEKVPGGFFSSAYIAFIIVTKPQNWKVQRRYVDFNTLRDILAKQNPGMALPFFSIKNSKPTEEKEIKQIQFCQHFLGFIQTKPQLLNSPIFELFLSLSTDKDWQNAVKMAQKQEKIKRLDELQTISGSVQLRINQELNLFFDGSEKFVEQHSIWMKNVRKLAKQLSVDTEKLSNTMFKLGDALRKIHEQAVYFNQHKPEDETFPILEDIHLVLSTMMNSWGHCAQNQTKLIDNTFYNSLKFNYYQIFQLQELIRYRDVAEREYIDYSQRLLNKKEKLFIQGDILRWELSESTFEKYTKEQLLSNKQTSYQLMLPKENYHSRELRDIFAFYNDRTSQEIKQVLKTSYENVNLEFLKFSKQQSLSIAELHQLWADTITNLQLLQEKDVQ